MIMHTKMKRAIPPQASLSCQTSYAARVAPQHCPVLRMSKSNFSVPQAQIYVNVQPWRRECSTSAVKLFNSRGQGVQPKTVRVFFNSGICIKPLFLLIFHHSYYKNSNIFYKKTQLDLVNFSSFKGFALLQYRVLQFTQSLSLLFPKRIEEKDSKFLLSF